MNEKELRNIVKEEIIKEIFGIGTHSHKKVKEQLDKLRYAKNDLQDRINSTNDKVLKEKLKKVLEIINGVINNLSKYENDWI